MELSVQMPRAGIRMTIVWLATTSRLLLGSYHLGQIHGADDSK